MFAHVTMNVLPVVPKRLLVDIREHLLKECFSFLCVEDLSTLMDLDGPNNNFRQIVLDCSIEKLLVMFTEFHQHKHIDLLLTTLFQKCGLTDTTFMEHLQKRKLVPFVSLKMYDYYIRRIVTNKVSRVPMSCFEEYTSYFFRRARKTDWSNEVANRFFDDYSYWCEREPVVNSHDKDLILRKLKTNIYFALKKHAEMIKSMRQIDLLEKNKNNNKNKDDDVYEHKFLRVMVPLFNDTDNIKKVTETMNKLNLKKNNYELVINVVRNDFDWNAQSNIAGVVHETGIKHIR